MGENVRRKGDRWCCDRSSFLSHAFCQVVDLRVSRQVNSSVIYGLIRAIDSDQGESRRGSDSPAATESQLPSLLLLREQKQNISVESSTAKGTCNLIKRGTIMLKQSPLRLL